MQEEINKLKQEIAELRALIIKNSFSNLYVFDTPVQFKRVNMYPTDNTVITTSVTDSTGRIAITIAGATKYIPYF